MAVTLTLVPHTVMVLWAPTQSAKWPELTIYQSKERTTAVEASSRATSWLREQHGPIDVFDIDCEPKEQINGLHD